VLPEIGFQPRDALWLAHQDQTGNRSSATSHACRKEIAMNITIRCAHTIAALAVIVLLGLLAPAKAQEKNKIEPPRPARVSGETSSPALLIEPGADYRIGSGDVISVVIEDAPELSRTFRVNAAGNISMSFLGRVKARDKTAEELADLIVEGLRGRYLTDPKVTVSVEQINSHAFFVQGAVRRPGVYQIEGNPSLLKLITVAGGLAENHGSTAFIIRQAKSPGGEEPPGPAGPPGEARDRAPVTRAEEDEAAYDLLKCNIAGLLKGRFDENASLEPGDIINIPVMDVFFVGGEVRAPGSYPLKDGTTLRQAISLAQGTTIKAATSRGVIFRENPTNGKREEIKVHVGAVMSGKQDDIPILANDIIIVPNSGMKSFGAALLGAFGLNLMRPPLPY
jgi:polysaccharide export outer membrane protein